MSMSSDADPDRLDAQDWRWLRANDLNRRSQRRRFDGDDRSSVRDSKETPERHPGGEEAAFQEADAEKVVREPSQGALQIREWIEPSKEDAEDHTRDALDFGLLDEDVAYVGIDADVPDFDWQDFAGDADEFDESPTWGEHTDEVRVEGRVSGRERAEQAAIELGMRYGWDSPGIRLLTDLFDFRYWGATRRAVERLLARGLTPDELEIAIQLRELWTDRTEFSIDLGRVSWWASNGSSAAASRHAVLSWPVALRLIRVTTALPDVVEIERLLDELYKEWYCSERLRYAFSSFNYYMLHWLDHMEAHPELRNMWLADFEAVISAHDPDNDENHFPGYTTPLNQELNRLGVLPVHCRTALEEQLKRGSAW